MLARTPAALKKRRYRRRLANGVIVLSLEVREVEFAEALLLAKRLTDRQALRRDLQEFTDRWRGLRPQL